MSQHRLNDASSDKTFGKSNTNGLRNGPGGTPPVSY